jgi:hypothetical protein
MEFINKPEVIVVCLALSVFRIYLEVIGFNFARLPLTAQLPQDVQKKIHKYGFYISVLYFVSFSPEILLS